jgi:hypothetical protein
MAVLLLVIASRRVCSSDAGEGAGTGCSAASGTRHTGRSASNGAILAPPVDIMIWPPVSDLPFMTPVASSLWVCPLLAARHPAAALSLEPPLLPGSLLRLPALCLALQTSSAAPAISRPPTSPPTTEPATTAAGEPSERMIITGVGGWPPDGCWDDGDLCPCPGCDAPGGLAGAAGGDGWGPEVVTGETMRAIEVGGKGRGSPAGPLLSAG